MDNIAPSGLSFDDYVGKEYEPFSGKVDRERLIAFSKAIGETNPVYLDAEAAKAAGYRDVLAPPTFSFTITLDAGQSFNVLDDMGIEHASSVHGAQWFTYDAPICAGDTISGQQKITEIFSKKGGALVFILIETPLKNQNGEPVATLGSTIVVRRG